MIRKASLNWRIDRMATVDRNILRLATFELMEVTDTPMKVVLNEAIELSKRYGSEDSSAFVNGVLDKIGSTLRPGQKK
jgi:N utilization substance protein B